MSRFTRGILCALAGAALWGFSGSCSQYLFSHYEISPMLLTTIRMFAAGILFVCLLFWRQKELFLRMLTERQTLRRLLLYGCIVFLNSFTYVLVISYTNAGTATVLQSINVIFCLFASCIIERRNPRLLEILGIVCALAATVLIATKGDVHTLKLPLAGLIWGIINALCCAFYIMYPKHLFERWGSLAPTGTSMLVGGICSGLIWQASSAVYALSGAALGSPAAVPHFALDGIVMLVIVVCLGTFAAYGLYLHGVSLVGAVRGSLLGTLEPVSAMLFSALWLSTAFVWADWLALGLMVLTIVLVSLQNTDESARSCPQSKNRQSAAQGKRPDVLKPEAKASTN